VEPGAGGARLQGKQRVTLAPGSMAARIFGRPEIEEHFHCSYGLNPRYQPLFDGGALWISGVGDSGEARVVELRGAGFFIGTLFLPQLRPTAEGPHPLISAFLAHLFTSA
jgi:CTP synthase (UTP-ammonia lyase)